MNKLSVKERIKAFETREGDAHTDVKLRDGKPKRKKPTSKAFEEFESQGILIGFVSDTDILLWIMNSLVLECCDHR